MGYCRRCGDINMADKCRKCGGLSVDSIAKSRVLDQATHTADRWQSQYASNILGDDAVGRGSRSTPSPSGRPRSMIKTCFRCKRNLQYTKSLVQDNQYYCESCHTMEFNHGKCIECNKIILPQENHIAHESSVWHQRCFRCWGCHTKLSEAVVDLQGRPSCESCLMSQSGKKERPAYLKSDTDSPNLSIKSSSISPVPTLGSSYSTSPDSTLGSSYNQSPLRRPAIDSHLFRHYEKSMGTTTSPSPASLSRSDSPPAMPAPTTSTPMRHGTPSSAPRPIPSSNASTPLRTRQTSSPKNTNHGSTARQASSPTTDKRRACFACEKPLSGQRIKLPTPQGDRWYHVKCMRCTTCGDQFTESEIVVGSKGIYHKKCHTNPSPLQPPSTPSGSASPAQVFECHTCQKAITEKCLKNGTRLFHPECFLCVECHTVLPYDQPFYDINDEAHCETCSQRKTDGLANESETSRDSDSEKESTAPHRHQADEETASSLLKNRTSALPKLGGSKKCPRCNDVISVMDDIPGPKATRWHKRCLRCEQCKKQMDSGAKVTEGKSGEWMVFCRTCTLKNEREEARRASAKSYFPIAAQ